MQLGKWLARGPVSTLPLNHYASVRLWLVSGAVDPSRASPTLLRLEPLGSSSRLESKASSARAHMIRSHDYGNILHPVLS